MGVSKLCCGVLQDSRYHILIGSLIVGLVIRFVLMPITSSPFDIGEGWVAIIDSYYAGDDLYQSGWYLYPPIWGYILSLVGEFTQFIGLTSFGGVFPVYDDRFNCFGYSYLTTLQFNFIIKTPGLIFDLLTGVIIYKLALRFTSDIKKACVSFALWFLAPITIVSSACLGMFDSIIVFSMVLALLAFLEKRYLSAGLLIGFGTVTKFFPLFLTPVMVAYVLSNKEHALSHRVILLTEAIIGFLVAILFAYLPVILTGEVFDSLTFITMRTEKAATGFTFSPSFNNIVYYLPLIVCEYLLMFGIMLFKKDNREKTLCWLLVFSMVPIFALPCVSYTPTYGVVLLPSVVILYCMKGRMALIPWLSLLVFPAHGVAHYWGQMFYPLGAFTNVVDLSLIPEYMGSGTIYTGILLIMCLSGFSFVGILAYCVCKKTLWEMDIHA